MGNIKIMKGAFSRKYVPTRRVAWPMFPSFPNSRKLKC